jgi:hypothetical protein
VCARLAPPRTFYGASQLALEGLGMPPLAKFGVVTLIAVPLCFALGYGLRKLPGVRCVM